jgi:hypothetical protein
MFLMFVKRPINTEFEIINLKQNPAFMYQKHRKLKT